MRFFTAMHSRPARYPHPMPVTTAPAREKRRTAAPRSAPRKRKKKSSGFLAAWWPLLLGIAVTPFAIHIASIMALAGPSALMTLYPWVLLLKSPALGLGNSFGDNLSQLLMYIQFPLYGVLMAMILRSKPLWIALGATAVTHFAAVFAVYLVAITHTP
jgi:hypothetical protein